MAFDAEIRVQLIETVRRFVREKCVPLEAQVGETDEMPQSIVDEMKALGLFGSAVPEEYGGLDLDMETECLVALELGRTSPAFRSVAGTNIGIGSQALKEQMVAGHCLWRFDCKLCANRARSRIRCRRGAHQGRS